MIDNNKEYIACAAVWYQNGKHYPFQNIYGIDNGFVIGSFRHPMCMSVCPENPYFQHKLVENGNETLSFEWNPDCAGETVEGFITSYGRFVGRKEAFKLALSCGQITRQSIIETQGTDIEKYTKPISLYSEDIFPKQCHFGTVDGKEVVDTLDLFPQENKTQKEIVMSALSDMYDKWIEEDNERIECGKGRLGADGMMTTDKMKLFNQLMWVIE